MSKIAVIGAGHLGSTIAFSIMKEYVADEIVMIDIIEDLVKGEGLDLGQTTICPVTGTMDYGKIKGSDLIVCVAGIARKPGMTREQLLGTNAKIMKSVMTEVKKHCPDAKILVVANPMDSMAYIAYKESGFDPNKIFGMGGIVDSNRFRYFLGMEFGVPVEKIEAVVIGQHGETMVPLASSVKIEGIDNLDKEKVERAIARTKDAGREVIALKGATSYAPAHATAQMAKMVMKDEKALAPCSVLLKDEEVFVGQPIILGANGVEEVRSLEMTDEEKALFKKAVKELRGHLSAVGY